MTRPSIARCTVATVLETAGLTVIKAWTNLFDDARLLMPELVQLPPETFHRIFLVQKKKFLWSRTHLRRIISSAIRRRRRPYRIAAASHKRCFLPIASVANSECASIKLASLLRSRVLDSPKRRGLAARRDIGSCQVVALPACRPLWLSWRRHAPPPTFIDRQCYRRPPTPVGTGPDAVTTPSAGARRQRRWQ